MAVRGAELLCASVPRLYASFTRDTIDRAIHEAVTKLGYSRASSDQVVAIREFILGRDVFVMLPTGSGKSFCYAALHDCPLYVYEYKHTDAVIRYYCAITSGGMSYCYQTHFCGGRL